MKRLEVDFTQTFAALEAGLRVELIAEFRLITCRPGERVAYVLGDSKRAAYDQFPVTHNGRTIGVMERGPQPTDELVESAMCPLDSSMLVSDGHPVGSLLDDFGTRRYRLVVKGGDISGIVTPSDFLKLPVRLYAFMLITHLEMVMAAKIRQEFRRLPMEEWLSLLSLGRQRRVRSELARHQKKRLDPDPIELLGFADKREVLRRRRQESQPFKRDLEEIEELRDSIAHAGTYLNESGEIEQFLERIRLARFYIDRLQSGLPQHYY